MGFPPLSARLPEASSVLIIRYPRVPVKTAGVIEALRRHSRLGSPHAKNAYCYNPAGGGQANGRADRLPLLCAVRPPAKKPYFVCRKADSHEREPL